MYCIIDAFLSQVSGKITVAKKPQKVVLFSSTQVLLFVGLKSTTLVCFVFPTQPPLISAEIFSTQVPGTMSGPGFYFGTMLIPFFSAPITEVHVRPF